MIIIRNLKPGEHELYREIRIRAVSESPGAFSASIEFTRNQPMKYWKKMTELMTPPSRQIMVLAEEDAQIAGCAIGFFREEFPGAGNLGSMWTDPAYRGRGVGGKILEKIIEWGKNQDLERMLLWVNVENQAAIRLYEKSGFKDTGEIGEIDSVRKLPVKEMVMDLKKT